MRTAPRPIHSLLLAPLALLACGERTPPDAEVSQPPPSVTVAPVLKTRLPDERERVGQVAAVEDVELRARITGFLEQRLFEEGTDVAKGQLLFVIERAPYEAKVARAEAEVARAKAALQEAELELRRTKRLRQQNVASQAALDAAVARQAEAEAQVLGAEASLREARLDLEYTEIRSPFSGRVGRVLYSVGDLVGPESGALATVATLDPIHVYWQVPETVILNFRRASAERARRGEEPLEVTARLRFGDGTFYEQTGVWDFLDNRVDPTTGTQTARAVFPNPDALLLPGQYATVIVQVGAPRETLVIPQAAVQEDQAGRFVLVVGDDDTAELRRVTMGAREGIYWEVRSGLGENERVIYQGVQKARPGSPVDAMLLRPEPPVGAAPEAVTGDGEPASPPESAPESDSPDRAPAAGD
jgi:membrane fusion protein (multidrug efflux system)